MMVMTAFGHTTEPIQKQQTVFVIPDYRELEAVNVCVAEPSTSATVELNIGKNVLSSSTDNRLPIRDVGWQRQHQPDHKQHIGAASDHFATISKNARDALNCNSSVQRSESRKFARDALSNSI